MGTLEERAEQASQLSLVPVETLGRHATTRKRMGELYEVIGEQLRIYDDHHEGGE